MTDSTRDETWAKMQPDGTLTESTFAVVEGTDGDIVKVDYDLWHQMLASQGWSQRAKPEDAEDLRIDPTDKSAASGPAVVNPEDGPEQPEQ